MTYGYRRIFSGLFFATFHLTIGIIPILPAFFGWMMIAVGVHELYRVKAYPAFHKSFFYSILITMICILSFITSVSGSYNVIFAYFPILIQILMLPFVYYLLLGSSQCLLEKGENNEATANKNSLNVYMVVLMLNTVMGCIALTLVSSGWLTLYAVVSLIQIIWLMIRVSRLKSIFMENGSSNHTIEETN